MIKARISNKVWSENIKIRFSFYSLHLILLFDNITSFECNYNYTSPYLYLDVGSSLASWNPSSDTSSHGTACSMGSHRRDLCTFQIMCRSYFVLVSFSLPLSLANFIFILSTTVSPSLPGRSKQQPAIQIQLHCQTIISKPQRQQRLDCIHTWR